MIGSSEDDILVSVVHIWQHFKIVNSSLQDASDIKNVTNDVLVTTYSLTL